MRKFSMTLCSAMSLFMTCYLSAETLTTGRIPQISNAQVNVWQTIIYPSQHQALKMHRHEFNRVVIAFDSGTLKVTNDKNQTHYLKLVNGQSYYLTKDVPGELHTDENLSDHPIKVTVVELKD